MNLGIMAVMSRLSRQIVSLFVAVLLVLSPLQGAMAGIVSLGQAPMPDMQHEMAGEKVAMDHGVNANGAHDMMQMDVAASGQQCEQCDVSACCIGGQCLSGHCATCAIGLVPVVSRFSESAGGIIAIAPDSTRLQQVPDTLLRPPRV